MGSAYRTVVTGSARFGSHLVDRLLAAGHAVTVLDDFSTGEPDCTLADTTRIQQRLGWRPRTSFEEGVQTMLAHIAA